ncbi:MULTISPECIES: heme biosynthesis HemY N-terminal domain-containing protein [unclassified Arsukibacterium]|uniref:heme biosynthesis HemY N-terminal domain-containing protein n=1 Tax=unclassified Arsukibacterium TaxID=2635278 RepID=UPI000C5C71FB|nr:MULTISPECIES: heme biosynthesis HemY N-terminal domain-containing protein [unclassified Arsukibacterium]MAA93457.1 heme biosynthesis protein HemY [Rheinheimera sp.]MBM34791.1 heme biosynthesis protein HemY [Rheinheimera sp.]HAW91629.1 heme biosynthesis protein HemY [Candidatus Azambacteria bacterium]|tara:strand:- start:3281 stop:4360 length:1080 start_codon:yes stop_codon:yes gene_type:complete
MIKAILLIVVLALAMFLGPVVTNNPGYIKLVLAGYVIEMTALGFGIVLTVVLVAIVLMVKLLKHLLRIQHGSFNFFRSRRQKKAQQAFANGLNAYARRQWPKAASELQQALQAGGFNGEKRFLAAYAAFYAGEYQQAKTLIADLAEDDPNRQYLEADMLLHQGHTRQAVVILEALLQHPPFDAALGQLYLRALQQAGLWQQVLTAAGRAATEHWFDKNSWRLQRFAIYPQALRHLAGEAGFEQQQDFWQVLPAKERKSAAAAVGLAWAEANAGQPDAAEKRLVAALSLADVAPAWPHLRQIQLGRSVLRLRKQIQHWLRDNPSNGYLYAVLAYLAEQEGEPQQAQQAWQKARQYQPELR